MTKNLYFLIVTIILSTINFGCYHTSDPPKPLPLVPSPHTSTDDVPRIVKLKGHTTWVHSAVFSPDGKTVVTASYDKTARIWDVVTGKELRKLKGHFDTTVNSLDFSDLDTVNSAVFSLDGKMVVTASSDKTARIWDVATGKELHKLDEHTRNVKSAVFSHDGKRVITTSVGSARIWDVATGKLLHKLLHKLVASDGKPYSSSGIDFVVEVNSAVFSPDDKTVVTASKGKTVQIWDVVTGELLHSSEGHTSSVNSAVFSPDGTMVVTASSDKTTRIWDVATGKELHKLEGHTWSVNSAVFSSDNKTVVTASKDGTARIWDAETGKELHKLEGHSKNVSSVAFSPDGKRIVTASWDNTALIWVNWQSSDSNWTVPVETQRTPPLLPSLRDDMRYD
jgi:WD40 repeat protein